MPGRIQCEGPRDSDFPFGAFPYFALHSFQSSSKSLGQRIYEGNMTIMEKFRSFLRRGTGEAVLIMQQYPRIDFSKEVFRASTHLYGYDPQCEGSRGDYLSRLIDLLLKITLIPSGRNHLNSPPCRAERLMVWGLKMYYPDRKPFQTDPPNHYYIF